MKAIGKAKFTCYSDQAIIKLTITWGINNLQYFQSYLYFINDSLILAKRKVWIDTDPGNGDALALTEIYCKL